MLDVVCEFADERAADAVIEMLDIAVQRAVPAGVALAIGDGELQGIRLYAGLLDPSAAGAVAASPQRFAGAASAIRQLVDSYRSQFEELGEQGLTLAYDFAIDDGLLVPWMVRYKVDLFCEPSSGVGRAAHLDWIEPLARSLGVALPGLGRFVGSMDRHFPGWTFQYVSLGCRDEAHELSVYCVPRALTYRVETNNGGVGRGRPWRTQRPGRPARLASRPRRWPRPCAPSSDGEIAPPSGSTGQAPVRTRWRLRTCPGGPRGSVSGC